MSALRAPVPRLPKVELSPTTKQYITPRPNAKKRPSYVRKFYPNEEAKNTLSQPWLRHTNPLMPPYPYGKNVRFPEANHGLYGGLTIQSGNKISKGRNKGRTLRKWYPNIRVEKLKSEALGVVMALPTAARVMRTIRKAGGLDEYVLGEKPARVKELGLLGWKLRWLVLNSASMRERLRAERAAMGLPALAAGLEETFPQAWANEGTRSKIIEELQAGWDKAVEKEKLSRKTIEKFAGKGARAVVNRLAAFNLHAPATLPLPEYIEEDTLKPYVVEKGFGVQTLIGRDGKQVMSTGRREGRQKVRDDLKTRNPEKIARKKENVLEKGESTTSGTVGMNANE